MTAPQTGNQTAAETGHEVAPGPTQFTLIGSDDAGYCIDGVCVVPAAPDSGEEH